MTVRFGQEELISSIKDEINEFNTFMNSSMRTIDSNVNIPDDDNTSCFKIHVMTGDQSEIRTKALIYIAFVGENCLTEFHLLNRRSMPVFYMRGSTEKFVLETAYINKIKYIIIKVKSSNETPISWYMKGILVENMKTGEYWETESSFWFSKDKEDGKMCRLIPMQVMNYKEMNHIVALKVLPRDQKFFKHVLCITCYGTAGKTEKISLHDGYLKKDTNFYRYFIKMKDIGQIIKIRIGILCNHHTSEKEKGNNSQTIRIHETLLFNLELDIHLLYSTESYTVNLVKGIFNDDYNKKKYIDIFSLNASAITETCELGNEIPIEHNEQITYDVVIWNYYSKYFNKLSSIYLQILGQLGKWSNIYQITDIKRQTGENADRYRIFGENLGPIKKIKVWHNKAGVAGGWHLDRVKIIRYLTPNEIMVTLTALKRQGKMPPGITMENQSIILNSEFNLNEPSSKLTDSCFKYKSSNGCQVINQSGDIYNNRIVYSNSISTKTKEKNVTSVTRFNKEDMFYLPFAEEFNFLCQTWLTLEEGDQTFEKIIPLCEKRFLYSPVKLILTNIN